MANSITTEYGENVKRFYWTDILKHVPETGIVPTLWSNGPNLQPNSKRELNSLKLNELEVWKFKKCFKYSLPSLSNN